MPTVFVLSRAWSIIDTVSTAKVAIMGRRQPGVTYKVEPSKTGDGNRLVRVPCDQQCSDLLDAPFQLEDFGFRADMHDEQIELLLRNNASRLTVADIRANLTSVAKPVSSRKDEDLEYFPDDGYDYSQHLVAINPSAMSKPGADMLKRAEEMRLGLEIAAELDEEGKAVLAALESDEASAAEGLDDDFVACAQTGPDGVYEPIDMNELLWGAPTEKSTTMPREVAERLAELQQALGGLSLSPGGIPDLDGAGSDISFSEYEESEYDEEELQEEFRDLFDDTDHDISRLFTSRMPLPEGFKLLERNANRGVTEKMTEDDVQNVLKRFEQLTDDNPIIRTGYEDESEEEKWDVQSVQSLRSNVYHHPGRIRIDTNSKKPILLYGKHRIPMDYIQDLLAKKAAKVEPEESISDEEQAPEKERIEPIIRPKDETTEAKRLRKQAVKQARREKRARKK